MLPVWERLSGINAVWPFIIGGSDIDQSELIELRTKRRLEQLVRLSRYARAGAPGALLGWDDVAITDIDALTVAVYDVLGSEGMLGRMTEEG